MPAKEWLVPLGLAALTFVGLLQLPEPQGKVGATMEVRGDEVRWIFEDGALAVPGQTVALGNVVHVSQGKACPALSPHGLVENGGLLSNGRGTMTANLDCPTPALVRLTVDAQRGLANDTAFIAVGDLHLVESPGPRFGLEGYNATRVTVHVFDGDGELVASNGNASEKARLTGKFAPNDLPGGTWYLGDNATAPDGTRHLPAAARALLPQLRALLVGLPEGGVATTHTDALSGAYGRLYVTARIDQLVHAP